MWNVNEMVNIPNYKMIRLDRETGNIRNNRNKLKRGGGLLFFVCDKLAKYTSINSNCINVS